VANQFGMPLILYLKIANKLKINAHA